MVGMSDAFDLMDVDDIAAATGMTAREVRKALREAEAAGFLQVESISPHSVILRGVLPDDGEDG